MNTENGVSIWWIFLSTVSILNIIVWLLSFVILARRKHSFNSNVYHSRRWILWLSGIYVLVCAFRSFLPRIDLERVCLVNTWLSNMLIGRSMATVAELCFIIQCAILLREAGYSTRNNTVIATYWLIVPVIVIAEGFSWYAAVSTNYMGSVIEESLWTISGVLLLICFISLLQQSNKIQRFFLTAMTLYGIGFVIFMLSVDVPMYWTRWQMDVANNVTYLSMTEGLVDMSGLCSVNFDWETWREEIPWMTLYFSVTVWVSIALAHAPEFRRTTSK